MRWKDSPRAVLLALLVIHVLAHIDRNMLLGFSPQITEDLALSNAQYGFLAGAVSDRLAAAGSTVALTTVLLATDALVILGALFFALAARGPELRAGVAPVIAH